MEFSLTTIYTEHTDTENEQISLFFVPMFWLDMYCITCAL